MNGAESLVRTLVAGGVDVCFANPGTSEMHFVAALDRVEGMRCILALFEGVVTGAADGYARMTGRPAATLLHLGPGLANGLANLHNASKAATPVVNIIGDHATYHRAYDAPLTSDIETAARPFCGWVRTSPDAQSVAKDGAEAIAAAMTPPGKVAALILPADTAWNDADGIAAVPDIPARVRVDAHAIAEAAKVLRTGEPTLILLGGPAVRAEGVEIAERIAAKTGAKVMAETFNARMERGAGRVPVDRIPYPVDQAVGVLAPFRHLILIGSKMPVAFFAYPNKPSLLSPPDCEGHVLCKLEEEPIAALEALAEAVGAGGTTAPVVNEPKPELATGKIEPMALGRSLGALLPENAIVV
ncbi:MAG: acetolactate synthase large subunit, partial [Hyphomicrobiales bacterium]|nr:acetolactate synthase large subunit [Hyphomicrobiales bacterium]